MHDTRWAGWLKRTTRADTSRDIAARVGVSHTTVLRWMRSGIPPDYVFAIGLRFGADLYETVIDMGWAEANELSEVGWDQVLRHVPLNQLTAEVHRRAEERSSFPLISQ